MRIWIAEHSGPPVLHLEGQFKLYRRLLDLLQYRCELNAWHRAQVHGAYAFASGYVKGWCVVFDHDVPRQRRRIECFVLPPAFGFGFVAELFHLGQKRNHLQVRTFADPSARVTGHARRSGGDFDRAFMGMHNFQHRRFADNGFGAVVSHFAIVFALVDHRLGACEADFFIRGDRDV